MNIEKKSLYAILHAKKVLQVTGILLNTNIFILSAMQLQNFALFNGSNHSSGASNEPDEKKNWINNPYF